MAKANSGTVASIAVEASLALAATHLAAPVRLTDARAIVSGLLPTCWDRWPTLADADRLRLSQFLRLRPDALADDRAYLREARTVLDRTEAFRWVDRSEPDPWLHRFEAVPGKPLPQLLDELLAQIARRRRDAVPADPTASRGAAVALKARRASFLVPAEHLGDSTRAWPTIAERAGGTPVVLDRQRLLTTAARIDAADVCGTHHRSQVASFLDDARCTGGASVPSALAVPEGRTRLVVAPTGRGKTVFSRVAAVDLACDGTTVAWVLPDVKEVLRECHALERLARATGLNIRAVPINSAAALIRRAEELLRHPTGADYTNWCLDRLAYHCRISAYVDAHMDDALVTSADGRPAVRPGDEPCLRLRAAGPDGERSVACPFAKECPKFDSYSAAATTATILVVNHAAMLAGRIPMPIQTPSGTLARVSVADLVLRRCALVMIDEVDQFQQRAIGRSTAGLQVSSRPRVSPAHELLIDLERRLASSDLPSTAAVERARQQLHFVPWLAGLVAALINRGVVRWPKRQGMFWPGARDGWLSARLFGTAPDAHERFGALFGPTPLVEPVTEALRQSLDAWARFDQEDDQEAEELQAALVEVLNRWPQPLSARHAQRRETLADVASTLVLRVLLGRLEQAIGRLRPQLATLEQLGLDAATTMRDGLLGYVPWRPAPAGALGRRVVGFSFKRHGDAPGALHAQVLSGDPHTFVTGLGDEVALALAGHRCAVLGFSATARFTGSPSCDVLAPVLFFQPDAATGISVEDAVVPDTDRLGKPLSVSGVAGATERHRRAERLGFLLWETHLRDHLSALAADEQTSQRARVLLVTGSYAESRVVARALARAIGTGGEQRVRFVARDRGSEPDPQVLLPREIETFGQLPAEVLVSPLSIVCRGHNILQRDSSASAIASVFVLVRPVPPTDTPARALAHVSYDAAAIASPSSRPGDAIATMRRRAEQQLRHIQQNAGPFGHLPADLRHHVLCDVLVALAQLAGRARRGGTDVRVYLVDGAFQGDHVGWRRLIADAFDRWASAGVLSEMKSMHRAFLAALASYSGFGG